MNVESISKEKLIIIVEILRVRGRLIRIIGGLENYMLVGSQKMK